MYRYLILAFVIFGFQSLFADTWVNGYYKSNGTYVPGHYRTHKNRTRNDNYSTIGNYNPYTGKPGTKPRDSFYDPFKKRKKHRRKKRNYLY